MQGLPKAPTKFLPAGSRVATPWRNGGGITREITVSPAGASLADFDWRVSMAEVTAAGPFSCFPGIDRILTIISGTMTLAIEGQNPINLSPNTEPFAFAGEAPCIGTPLNGAVTDLNVMVRRARYTAELRRPGTETVQLNTSTCLFLALSQSTATLANDSWQLNQFDALLIKDRANAAIMIEGKGWIIDIKAR
jgi:environmental stress-induced protein Ves